MTTEGEDMEEPAAATREELTQRCGHECLNRPDHDGPHFYGYIGGRYSYKGLLAENERLRAALERFVKSPVIGQGPSSYGLVVQREVWNDGADLVGYDEMGG